MIRSTKDMHEEVDGLLPWLINNSLAEKEREKVLAHLLICEQCRGTRDELQSLGQFIVEDDVSTEEYRPAYLALQKRIDAAEREKQVLAGFEFGSNHRLLQFGRSLSWLLTRNYYASAIASVVLAVFIITPILINESSQLNVGDYSTLTTTSVQDETSNYKALITFNADVDSDVIREILIQSNAKIIRNAESDNSFVVELEVPVNVPSATFFEQISKMDSVISVVSAAD